MPLPLLDTAAFIAAIFSLATVVPPARRLEVRCCGTPRRKLRLMGVSTTAVGAPPVHETDWMAPFPVWADHGT